MSLIQVLVKRYGGRASDIARKRGEVSASHYSHIIDWHGHVIAEENAIGVPTTYLGIHFPASDIPAQVTLTLLVVF